MTKQTKNPVSQAMGRQLRLFKKFILSCEKRVWSRSAILCKNVSRHHVLDPIEIQNRSPVQLVLLKSQWLQFWNYLSTVLLGTVVRIFRFRLDWSHLNRSLRVKTVNLSLPLARFPFYDFCCPCHLVDWAGLEKCLEKRSPLVGIINDSKIF